MNITKQWTVATATGRTFGPYDSEPHAKLVAALHPGSRVIVSGMVQRCLYCRTTEDLAPIDLLDGSDAWQCDGCAERAHERTYQ